MGSVLRRADAQHYTLKHTGPKPGRCWSAASKCKSKFTMSSSGMPPVRLVDRIRRLLPSRDVAARIRKQRKVAAAVGRYLDVLRCANPRLLLIRCLIAIGWDFWQQGASGYLPCRFLCFTQALTLTRTHSNRARCHLSLFPS